MFDIDSLYGYCAKYGISKARAKKIVSEFNKKKPELVTESKYFTETSGYVFSVEGRTVTIEMWNMIPHGRNNVTFIGFEGVNI